MPDHDTYRSGQFSTLFTPVPLGYCSTLFNSCYHLSRQTHRRHAAVYRGGWNRCGSDGHAAPTSILRADVAADEELGRFDIQLFGDILANLDQSLPNWPQVQDSGFVPVFDARQVIRQGLPTDTRAFGFCGCPAGSVVFKLLDFRFDCGKVGIKIFLEHIPLQGGARASLLIP